MYPMFPTKQDVVKSLANSPTEKTPVELADELFEKAKKQLEEFNKDFDLERLKKRYNIDFIINLMKLSIKNKRNKDKLIIYNEKTNQFVIDYERISYLVKKSIKKRS